MVAGLDFQPIWFAVLPPHFAPAELALLTDEFWGEIMSNYDAYPNVDISHQLCIHCCLPV